MTYLLNYGKRLLWTFIILFISLIAISTLYYFNLISPNTYKVLEITILLLSIFINSFILGKKSNKRGYLEGIKFSSIIIVLFIILSIILSEALMFRNIIYYLIIMITSILGSMIGINKRKD